MRFAIAVFLLGSSIYACSCSSYEPVQACEVYQRTAVIFRGRVIGVHRDLQGAFGRRTLYRFRVLETFKGLDRDIGEVFIDPLSYTSCARSFTLDAEYLVYAGAEMKQASVNGTLFRFS